MPGAPEYAWVRTPEVAARANVTRLMGALGVADLEALRRHSVEDLPGFWSAVVDDLAIPFRAPWRRVMDDSAGPQWTTWFVGAASTSPGPAWTAGATNPRGRALRPSSARPRTARCGC